MNIEDFNLELFIGTKDHTVGSAPVGLLLLENGTIICKSEYKTDSPGGSVSTCDCIIVNSGENYCGGDGNKCISIQII